MRSVDAHPANEPVSVDDACVGPVPLSWLLTAAKPPGKSLHVGVALWYLAARSGSASVLLSNTICASFGLDRNSKYRGLHSLESAKLIVVLRRLGQSPAVTILALR